MGYTQCWYRDREIPVKEYAAIKDDFGKVINALPLESKVAGADGFAGPEDISFTGLLEGCEPLVFPRITNAREITPERAGEAWMIGKRFEFCKTEHAAYDLAVTAFLIAAKRHLGNKVRIFTDGSDKDWEPAKTICAGSLGYGAEFRIQNRELSI